MDFLTSAREAANETIAWQRALHQVPETGLQLPLTTRIIEQALKDMDVPFETFSGHSGILGLIRGALPGKTVALRADMDGLLITEQTGLPHAAKNNCMHACGHDGHMAMLLGAAKLLVRVRDRLCGNVKLIFQPAEESVGGAQRMIEDGVLENPRVDAIFGQHCGNLLPNLPHGAVAFKYGPMLASRDTFLITVTGKGCHGATPAEGIDPVVVSAHIITALQVLVSRECNGTDCAVLTVGSMHAGDAYNIIPERATLYGSIRSLDEAIRGRLKRRIPELAGGIARAFGAEASCAFEDDGYPVTASDGRMVDFARAIAVKLLGPDRVHVMEQAIMVSEDMSCFLNAVPGCFWFFLTPPARGERFPNHNPHFSIDSSLLPEGSALLAQCAYDFLKGAETAPYTAPK